MIRPPLQFTKYGHPIIAPCAPIATSRSNSENKSMTNDFFHSIYLFFLSTKKTYFRPKQNKTLPIFSHSFSCFIFSWFFFHHAQLFIIDGQLKRFFQLRSEEVRDVFFSTFCCKNEFSSSTPLDKMITNVHVIPAYSNMWIMWQMI